jgi:MerR family mercuric resistance operon transcriptional regulator
MNKQAYFTIGGLAKLSGVGVETVRYYERKGIIEQPPKTEGFRYYDEDYAKRIRLVKKMQEVGFTLEEIKAFLVYETCSETRPLIQQKSKDKIAEIKQKIADLNSALQALETFVCSCGSDDNTSLECELLDCFENQWECCAPPISQTIEEK